MFTNSAKILFTICIICICFVGSWMLGQMIKTYEKINHVRYEEKRAGEISKTPPPVYGHSDIQSVCLDGVKYYILKGIHEKSLTPALQPDGKPALCGQNLTPRKEYGNALP